jgi:TPR repeat protein
MLHLGLMFLQGKGVPIDVPQGTDWLRKSAKSGNEQAQQLLKQNGLNW